MKQNNSNISNNDKEEKGKEWKERETASNGRTVPLGVNQKRRVGNSQTGHRM